MSNNINIYFLGDCGSCPTKDRNLSSMLFNYDGKNYLLDCPENIQQQLMKKKISVSKIKAIFITHLHGDHYFGILGLLSTMNLNNKEDKLYIFVPKGNKQKLSQLISLTHKELLFKMLIIEVDSKYTHEFNDLEISCVKLNHSIETYGYIFKIKDKLGKFDKEKAIALGIPEGPLFSKLQENKSVVVNKKRIYPKDVIDHKYKKIGFKFAYLLDTAPLKTIPQKLNNLDLLICEATFLEEHKQNAKKYKHLTTKDVGDLAKEIKPKKLFITHISSRYKDIKEHEKEIQKYFKKAEIPNKEKYVFETFI